jgi:methylmalonyl-CoA/ethylmalonyl-CoA epimerase
MGVGNTGNLHHTSWIVEDLEATARRLASDLAVRWSVWTIEPEVCIVRGREVPYSFRVAIAAVGDSNLELVQPLEGHSVYVEHLADSGEGYHHTCFIYPSLESLRAAKAELEAQGRELIQTGGLGDLGEFHYFEVPELGSVLEVLYLTELPAPEALIE